MNKLFTMFQKPDARKIAEDNLAEYQRQLLTSEAAAAYHAKMAEYYRESIQRLRNYEAKNATLSKSKAAIALA